MEKDRENRITSNCASCAFLYRDGNECVCVSKDVCRGMSAFLDKDQEREKQKGMISQKNVLFWAFKDEVEKGLEGIERKSALSCKKVLTFDEMALYMGVSKSYLYKMTSNKEIPHYKPMGKLVFFDREEVEKWLCTHKVE